MANDRKPPKPGKRSREDVVSDFLAAARNDGTNRVAKPPGWNLAPTEAVPPKTKPERARARIGDAKRYTEPEPNIGRPSPSGN